MLRFDAVEVAELVPLLLRVKMQIVRVPLVVVILLLCQSEVHFEQPIDQLRVDHVAHIADIDAGLGQHRLVVLR